MKFLVQSLFAFAQANPIQSGDVSLIRQLIAEVRSMKTVAERMKHISAKLLGAAYLRRPLIGSPTEAEVLVTRMDGFDCITFLETLLAVARAKSHDEFLALLKKIRYRNGAVEYQQRLHYASEWANHLVQLGMLTDMTGGETVIEREKLLDVVQGIQPINARLHYYPRHELAVVSRWLKNGDWILFASGRKGLDVSHAGLIVRNGEQVWMRHATRSHRKVIEQDLIEFFGILPMNGFMIYRPKEI
ncbi:MAG: N-acetylmuramoyl-L-alanine amidase-like domain-containing protein [Acidobacteriota bacterium]